ncbi:Predicted PurR-regulated permease PerM [Formosa sp. Hel1_31_208]|uniref:AI-2E family transporter n=1 Tax=Formosa sp. Hel1_31_208 TaxID=1798225 RepID=UPI00087BAA47|nr:AI-2E family transporter [Formosa sp. Hel1_31_208]SDS32608.1 Predicted PurR-regulated permease PerM [Formosa sp. Hel1_31_208]
MNSRTIANGILRALGIIVAIALVLYFLYQIRSVIVYVLIAAVISLIGRPIVLFLRKRLKFKNIIAVISTMLFLIGIFVGIISLLIPLLVEQGQNLSLLDIDQLKTNIEELYRASISYLELNHIDAEKAIKESKILSSLDYSIIPNFLNNIASGLGSFGIGLMSVLFIAFFFLKDSNLFQQGVLTFVPNDKESRTKRSFTKISDLLSRYFVGLFFQILILFVIYTIGLLIIGIKNAVVIAFLCALINLIPYLGPLIGGVLMLLLVMTNNLSDSLNDVILPNIIYTVIIIVIAQLIDNFFSQPFIFSKSVKSHPLEIFLIIIIAGILFGVVGMIVAIPCYTAIKVILKEFLSENMVVKKLTQGL